MLSRRNIAIASTGLAGILLGACASATLPSPASLVTNASSEQTLAPTTTQTTGDLTLVDPLGDAAATGLTSSSLVPDALVSVYSRLARGLNRCWLRDGRPLGLAYVMYAKIDPAPATTGTLTVHLRSPTGRRALKAYQVDLSTASGQTRVTTTNIKLLPKQSRTITKDVVRWATGGTACGTYTAHVPAPRRKPGQIRRQQSAF